MIFDLTDEDRDGLERVRASMGLRSHAEALRQLIRDADSAHTETMRLRSAFEAMAPAAARACVASSVTALPPKPRKADSRALKAGDIVTFEDQSPRVVGAHVDAPVYKRGEFRPNPKTGKR